MASSSSRPVASTSTLSHVSVLDISEMDADVSHILGNASPDIKRILSDTKTFFAPKAQDLPDLVASPRFVHSILERFRVTEVSVSGKKEAERRLEGRVVVEVLVQDDMINGIGHVHGACSVALIDMCSALALQALVMSTSNEEYLGVSQMINVIYHSPATLGDTLRIINTTISVGARSHSAHTEIWNLTENRLMATGSSTKMVPSTRAKL